MMNSPVNWSQTEWPSVWMAVAEPWIISLLNASGAVLSMKK